MANVVRYTFTVYAWIIFLVGFVLGSVWAGRNRDE
jgi:hypothetical protein